MAAAQPQSSSKPSPFKIVKQPRAWWPVTFSGVTEDGAIVENAFELRMLLLKDDAFAEFLWDAQEAADAELARGADRAGLYAPLVARIADDWRGVHAENDEPLRWDVPAGWRDDKDGDGRRRPLNAPNLRLLMNEPGMFTHVVRAFRACQAAQPQVREGN